MQELIEVVAQNDKVLDIFYIISGIFGTLYISTLMAKYIFKHGIKKEEERREILESATFVLHSNNMSSDSDTNFSTIYKLKQDTLNELSDKRRTDKLFKKWSFILAILMSIIGTIILFAGMILSFFFANKIEWVTIVSGVIVEFMAGVYFALLNKTMTEVKDNSQQLEETKNQITAIELIENIKDDKTKDLVYQKMIESLIAKK